MLIRGIPASQVSTPDINNTLALKLEYELNALEDRGVGGVAFRVNRLTEIVEELFAQLWRFCALAVEARLF